MGLTTVYPETSSSMRPYSTVARATIYPVVQGGSMITLFRGKADHPMADPKEARRILDALPAQEGKAVDELAQWHESVSTAAGFKPGERLQLIGGLDDAAQPRLRKLSAAYFASPRPSRYQENLLWTQVHGYWRQ